MPTQKGFEPSRGNPNGLAVHRLNHSATASIGPQGFAAIAPLLRVVVHLAEWAIPVKKLFRRRRDSNPQSSDPKSDAIAISPRRLDESQQRDEQNKKNCLHILSLC